MTTDRPDRESDRSTDEQPMTEGDPKTILGGAIGYIRVNPAFVIGVTAVGVTVGHALGLVAQLAGDSLVASLGAAAVEILVLTALYGLLLVALSRAVLGQRIGFGEAWRAVAPRLRGLVGLILLAGLIILVLAQLAEVLLGDDPIGVLAGVGAAGALLVAVWLAVGWILAAPAYVLEDIGVMTALSRSWSLVRGAWWRVFGIALVMCLVSLAVGVIVGLPFGVATFLNADPLPSPEPPSFDDLIRSTIASIIADTLTWPFAAGVTGLLYVDQRVRQGERLDDGTRPTPPAGPLAPSPAIPRPRRDATTMAALIGVVAIGLVAVVIPNPGEDLFAPEQEFHTGHSDDVKAVAIAQLDGRPVIVSGGGNRDGTVRVWDLSTGAPIGQPIVSDNWGVDAVAVAQLDGRPVIVVGYGDGAVQVWDLATRAPIGQPIVGSDYRVNSVAVAQLDGRPVIVSGNTDSAVQVWDLATGAPIGRPFARHDYGVPALAVAQLDDRPVVVVGHGDGTVQVWDLAKGSPIGEPLLGEFSISHPVEQPVIVMAVGQADGRPVIVSTDKDRVRVRDLATRAPIGEFTGHDGDVSAVAVGQLDGRAVIVSGNWTVRVWDLATGASIGEPFTGGPAVRVLAVALGQRDGRPVIVSGGEDNTIRMWDLATGAPIGQPFAGRAASVRALTVGQLDGRPVIVFGDHSGISGDRGTVRVWGLATGAPIGLPFAGHNGGVFAVAVGQLDGRPVIVSGGDDGAVRVWDLATGTPINDLTGHTDDVLAVAVGQLDVRPVVVSGGGDGAVRVWDLATGDPIGGLTGHDGGVSAVAVGQLDGRPVVVSGGGDGAVRVWDLATGTPISQRLTGSTRGVLTVAVAQRDGRPVVVSGGRDGTVRVSDLATGAPIGRGITGHTGGVSAVAVGQLDGRAVIVSGGEDETVRVWDLATGASIGRPLSGHTRDVYAVATAQLDGRTVLVSGSEDTTIRTWGS